MANVSLKEVLEVTGGRLLGSYDDFETVIGAVETNTRRIKGGSMFVPYKGGNADGHDFIGEAMNKGCIGCLTEKPLGEYRDDKFYVLVENALESLWEIIKLVRSRMNTKLICVTGSVGKTTTTGMIASVLRRKYKVFETEENMNDEFVGPEMVFKITDEHEYAVLELGLGMHSSVRKMSMILKPDMLVLTRIGYAHIEKTGSLEATRDEKCGAEDGLPDDGLVIVNGNDNLMMEYPFKHEIRTYSPCKMGLIAEMRIPAHLEYAAYAAAAVGLECGMGVNEILIGIRTFAPAPGRMDIIKRDRYILIDASFNANVESIGMALDTLAKFRGRKIAVIGEILEVGDYAEKLHTMAGRNVTKDKADVLIAVGDHAVYTAEAARNNGVATYAFRSVGEATGCLLKIMDQGKGHDVIMVKGSHGSGVWMIAESLKNLEVPDGKES